MLFASWVFTRHRSVFQEILIRQDVNYEASCSGHVQEMSRRGRRYTRRYDIRATNQGLMFLVRIFDGRVRSWYNGCSGTSGGATRSISMRQGSWRNGDRRRESVRAYATNFNVTFVCSPSGTNNGCSSVGGSTNVR